MAMARRGPWMGYKLAEQNLGHQGLGDGEQVIVGSGTTRGLGDGLGHRGILLVRRRIEWPQPVEGEADRSEWGCPDLLVVEEYFERNPLARSELVHLQHFKQRVD